MEFRKRFIDRLEFQGVDSIELFRFNEFRTFLNQSFYGFQLLILLLDNLFYILLFLKCLIDLLEFLYSEFPIGCELNILISLFLFLVELENKVFFEMTESFIESMEGMREVRREGFKGAFEVRLVSL